MTRLVVVGHLYVHDTHVARIRQVAPDIETIDIVDDLRELRDRLHRPEPHVGIVFAELATLDVAAVTRQLTTAPDDTPPPFLVASRKATGEQVARALHDGARGFLLVDSPVEELITAVRAVVAGYLYIPSAYVKELAGTLLMLVNRQHGNPPGGPLTQREHDVLALLARGLPNSEIARRLYISEATVRTHVLNVLRKLDVRNRTEAVVLAYQLGLLAPGLPGEPVSTPTR